MTTLEYSGSLATPDGQSGACLTPPGLAARISHRLARHLPLHTLQMKGGPLVSFTFDDVPLSALTAGAAILEEHGLRGTFYIAGSLLNRTGRHWRVIGGDGVCELAARGHEIGCHTFSHIRADQTPPGFLAADMLRNRQLLQAIDPSLRLENFAYPFGYGDFGWKRQLAKVFRSGRGIVPGVVSDRFDPQFLHSAPLVSGRFSPDDIDRLLDEAAEKKGWVIFYSHDVAARPSPFGCTPKLLTHALNAAARRGIAGASVAGALDRIAAAV